MKPTPAVPPNGEERFRRLFADSYPDLVRFAERRVDPSEAEDVASTVFLTAWRRFADMPADARPWLFGIARNVIANQNRGGTRRRFLDVRITELVEVVGSTTSAESDARLDLSRAWKTLPPRDRETLALVAFDGLTSDQAASVVGCLRSTFAMRLARARHRLHVALREADSPLFDSHPPQKGTS